MLDLESAICKEEALAYSFGERYKRLGEPVGDLQELEAEHRQIAEWLRELKAYREDTRFADLYERICTKRDDDREYFARTKDKTYITRIAEKEMFIHMMQDMMFDRYGCEEVNADADSD